MVVSLLFFGCQNIVVVSLNWLSLFDHKMGFNLFPFAGSQGAQICCPTTGMTCCKLLFLCVRARTCMSVQVGVRKRGGFTSCLSFLMCFSVLLYRWWLVQNPELVSEAWEQHLPKLLDLWSLDDYCWLSVKELWHHFPVDLHLTVNCMAESKIWEKATNRFELNNQLWV